MLWPVKLALLLAVPAFELKLPAALESQRTELVKVVEQAQARLERFAVRYDWQFVLTPPLLKQAEIFASKADYDEHLRRTYPEAREMVIPQTFVAGFEGENFFAVSPRVYEECVPQFLEEAFYEKLLTHELAHRLHIRLVNGNEEKMGPIWFWEGFATFASGQFESDATVLSREQIQAILQEPKRGDYRQYNRVLKYFVKLVPLPELVRRAAQPGFNEWLLENAAP